MLGLPPPQPGFELLISSHGISQGLSQSDGIQLFPRAFVRSGRFRIGGQWRNISSPTANGVAAAFAKLDGKVGSLLIDGGISYRVRTGSRGRPHSEAWEFSAGTRRSFGKLTVRANAEYSPDEFGAGPSLWLEAGPSFDLDKTTKVSGNLGLRERGGVDYRTLNAGISRVVLRKVTLDARFYATDQRSRGHAFRQRVVLSARLAL